MFRDPRWQRRRLEILQRDDWRCRCCGEGGKELHVHHRRYRSGEPPWNYTDEELITLCTACHNTVEEITFNCRANLPLLNRDQLTAVYDIVKQAIEDPVPF
jgi:5-methylcytosine-specific restriction endonuclease McrA